MVIFLIICLVIIALVVSVKRQNKKSRIENGVPEGFKFLHYKAGSLGLTPGTICAWAVDKKLKFSDITGAKQTEISLDRVIKVDFNSDVQTVTTGGGRSVGGAVAGGLVLGPVGAIVGSRSKTKTRQVDRSTVHVIFTSENGIEQALIFNGMDYNNLLRLVS